MIIQKTYSYTKKHHVHVKYSKLHIYTLHLVDSLIQNEMICPLVTMRRHRTDSVP